MLNTINEIQPGCRVGRYHVSEVFPDGRGGMARVVLARSTDSYGSPLALKISCVGVLKNYYFAAIQKEVEVLQLLHHRGVSVIKPVSNAKNPYKERATQIDEQPWFFGMEHLRGGTLARYVADLGRLELEEVTAICIPVAEALEYVHCSGFAHNDIKPSNILFRKKLQIGARFEPVLIDFGVAAKLVKYELAGSIEYMSPERLERKQREQLVQAIGTRALARADIWSMGILIYRLVTGRLPFASLNERVLVNAILRNRPVSMRDYQHGLPARVDEFVLDGCLAKDPRVRVSIGEFQRFFRNYGGNGRILRVPGSRDDWRKRFFRIRKKTNE
ncbi:MAG: serine/threonine protein kinase [Phycisphaerae bacterium]|nr:serine/threonine protein kinase [Phycisphaerae bacterium]